MVTLIIAHPWHGSFNFAILKALTDSLDRQKREYQVIDLCADGFDPRMGAENLRLYSKGETADALADKYADALMASDEVAFIFPIWWAMMPAELKGFFDKVFLKGKILEYDMEGNLVPLLNIKKNFMFTTSQSPSEIFKPFFADYLKPHVFDSVGLFNMEWVNCEQTAHGPAENREEYLKKVAELI